MPWIDRRMDFSVRLASSLISSSERMQRLISSFNGVRGSKAEKNPSRESAGRSSRSARPNALARLAASNRELSCKNSGMLKAPPISRRFKDAPNGWMPEKERLPFLKIRESASFVCLCASRIAESSVIGSRFLHCSFAAALNAYPVNVSIILSYSNVRNAF